MLKKKFWPSFQRVIELFTQKFVTKFLKIWGWDPGSEIRDPEKNLFRIPDPDPGSKRHRIPDPDPQHCQKVIDPDPGIQNVTFARKFKSSSIFFIILMASMFSI
jgi:hypothetical protein